MSVRHYLIIEKEGKKVFSNQILGNHDYFDEEFYEEIGVELDDCCELEKQEINILKLMVAWYKWFKRHPERLGVGLKDKPDITEKQIFYDYLCGLYYQLQPYFLMKDIYIYIKPGTEELKEGCKAYLKIV